MTRRIVMAILVIAWGVLLVGSTAAYLATRAILLADLDDTLLARATAMLQFTGEGTGQPIVPPEDRFILRNERGQTLARPAVEPQAFAPPRILDRSFITLADGHRMRRMTLATSPMNAGSESKGPITLVYSTSAERLDRTLTRLAAALAIICSASGVLAAWAAARASRAALAPLHQTAQTIGQIDERQLDRRIDCDALPDELRPMARQLNAMLQRLEQVFAQRRQFLADAAHELRTPVAALLTTLEVTLRRPRDAAALTASMEDCLCTVRVLRRLVDTLLEQARSEQAFQRQPPEAVDVAAMVRECAALAEALGAEQGIQVISQAPESLEAVLHPDRLRSVITNFAANAVQYNRPGGRVELACGLDEQGIWLRVSDTGVGIPPESLPHVFEPFYRGDQAHRQQAQHLGLGLFLVKSHVEAMGGTCSVESTPSEGTRFQVRLPCQPPPKSTPSHAPFIFKQYDSTARREA